MSVTYLEDYINSLYSLLEQEEEQETPDAELTSKDTGTDTKFDGQAPAEVDTLTREQLKYILKNSKGKIITVVFKKKDGSIRVMNTRTGVVKNIKGVGLPYDPEKYGYFILWDMKKGNYRTVNANTVTALKSGGKTYTITENLQWRPVFFKNGGAVYHGEAAWNQWKRWADFNRKNEFLYKVLTSIKNQRYLASPKQQEVLLKWFNSKR